MTRGRALLTAAVTLVLAVAACSLPVRPAGQSGATGDAAQVQTAPQDAASAPPMVDIPLTPAPTAVPTPTAAPPTAAPAPQPPPAAAQPPAPPPPPAASVFALSGAGSGSVRVTRQGGSIVIDVTVAGIASGLHAVHVHRGCDGSGTAHLLTLSSVFASGGAGSSSTTIGVAAPGAGWTVIVYPGSAAAGRPVLCAAIG